MKAVTLKKIVSQYEMVKEQVNSVLIGQEKVVDNIIISLFAGGHVLIEGVPGLGKTLLANTLSFVLGGKFNRVQFTPDLMPSDITGTTIFNSEINKFQIKKGPVFTNLLLADEINRSPAKTQSALLQAMQEREVTIDGKNYPLSEFFICMATQNPIEMEGTYPLPEAQVDRFLMKIFIDYPSADDEINLLAAYRKGFKAEDPSSAGIKKVLSEKDIITIKKNLHDVTVDDKILQYITSITTATRNYPGIEVGCSPRGSVALFQTSRVQAVINERDFVTPDDVKDMALPVLRHRIILEAEAELEGSTPDEYLARIINETKVPR